MWDRDLTPSCWHGVTTVVMGNCSVGFAPCAPERRDWLIEMMESVEDIPASALRAGLDWSWETFPEYLDALDRDGHVADVGTQIPHAAVRAYVMGERGARNEAAGRGRHRAMAAIVADALRAGALGFSTSRTTLHHTADGQPIAGTFAARRRALRDRRGPPGPRDGAVRGGTGGGRRRGPRGPAARPRVDGRAGRPHRTPGLLPHHPEQRAARRVASAARQGSGRPGRGPSARRPGQRPAIGAPLRSRARPITLSTTGPPSPPSASFPSPTRRSGSPTRRSGPPSWVRSRPTAIRTGPSCGPDGTACSPSVIRSTTSPGFEESVAGRAAALGIDPGRAGPRDDGRRPWGTVHGPYQQLRGRRRRGVASHAHPPGHRCSASPTGAPMSPSSAMRACRRPCSPTGYGIVAGASGCRSSSWCSARPVTPPGSTDRTTAG